MSSRITLPLKVVEYSTYLGEVVLKEPVKNWIKNKVGCDYRSGLNGPVCISATRPDSFPMVYERVKPYIVFESPEDADEFHRKWCA